MVQDDYYVTPDQMYVPLRWIAPELVDEVHGNLLVADQSQQSNMWYVHKHKHRHIGCFGIVTNHREEKTKQC